MLPPEYAARCPECKWRMSTTDKERRDTDAARHANTPGHKVTTHDYV